MRVRFPLARKNRVEMSVCVKKLHKMGLVLARVRRGEAVGIAFTERLKLGRQMAEVLSLSCVRK